MWVVVVTVVDTAVGMESKERKRVYAPKNEPNLKNEERISAWEIPLFWIWGFLIFFSLCRIIPEPSLTTILTALIGTACSTVSLWTWLRISCTHQIFLKMYYAHDVAEQERKRNKGKQETT